MSHGSRMCWVSLQFWQAQAKWALENSSKISDCLRVPFNPTDDPKWDSAIGVELKVTCLLSCREFYQDLLSQSLFTPLILRYQDLYGNSIAFTIRSVDRSLISRLILLFMGCFGDCLNHGFSLIKRITRIMGSLSRSLSSRLILFVGNQPSE